jgi:hypothetical protein
MGVGTEPLTDGSAAYPWLIEDLADFDVFAGDSAYWAVGVHTQLMTDIDLSNKTYQTAVIAPDMDTGGSVSFVGTAFSGIFDGNDLTIDNLTIENGNDYIGLFGQINSGGEIKNLGVVDANVVGGGFEIGALCGRNMGNISNCYSTGTVIGTNGSSKLGGLCGQNRGGNIGNCFSACDVSGGDDSEHIGGLCGYRSGGSISDCYSTGIISGGANSRGLGGLCGVNFANDITSDCFSTSDIIGGNGAWQLGGLCGYTDGDFCNSFATGKVVGGDASDEIGGLFGRISYSTISHCYAIGDIITEGNSGNIGGLCGSNYCGSITNCYSTGSINGTGNGVGGLTGDNYGGIISNCFSTAKVSGYYYVGGLVGSYTARGTIGGGYIINCYSTGSVSGDTYVGGLLGAQFDGSITNCYSTGLVTGNVNVGGFIGYGLHWSNVGANFWDIETSGIVDPEEGLPDTDGIVGKSITEMMAQSTFIGWDFVNNWMMLRPGEDFPRLAWQAVFEGDIAGLYGVDLVDFSYLANYWGLDCDMDDCGRADIDGSGDVGLADLVYVSEDWLKE